MVLECQSFSPKYPQIDVILQGLQAPLDARYLARVRAYLGAGGYYEVPRIRTLGTVPCPTKITTIRDIAIVAYIVVFKM